MKLSQILKDTSLRTAADCEITHITNDSRDVFPGTVFFAMKKFIHQTPWYAEGANKPSGLVEISVILPETIPHYVRN